MKEKKKADDAGEEDDTRFGEGAHNFAIANKATNKKVRDLASNTKNLSETRTPA